LAALLRRKVSHHGGTNMASRKADIVRGLFAAYKAKDRDALERVLADGFTFTSPYDDAIDKATYFERCWPNSILILENVLERIVFDGENVAFVLYTCRTHAGEEFRNTEIFTFDGDKVKHIDVYFGATYRNGNFVRKSTEN
jgi:ketosteroid isomerase-like protein